MDSRTGGSDGIEVWRGRRGVAASLLAVVLVSGYFAAAGGDQGALPGVYALNAAILVVAFWFPAMRVGSVADVVRQWLPLLVWILAWTLVWDLTTSGIWGHRHFLQEWWLVYPSGVAVLGLLLLLHATVVRRVERRR